jgi:serpin B
MTYPLSFRLCIAASMMGFLLADAVGLRAQQPITGQDEVVQANNRFAIELFRAVDHSDPGKNQFLSPFSISTAMAMTFEGARGQTRSQMASVLHLDMSDDLRQHGFSALMTETSAAPQKQYRLSVANALWVNKGFPLSAKFTCDIQSFYGGAATPVDFAGAPRESLATINRWVEDKTAGKIQNLVHPDNIDAQTRLILTNAIYFKGQWARAFRASATQPEDFHLDNGTTVKVPMMEQKARFAYAHLDGMAAIELPYKDNDLSLIAILPDGEMKSFLAGLTLERIEAERKALRPAQVSLYLPKFKFETRYLLEDLLRGQGMTDAFDEEKADFSGMTGNRDLYIGHVIHQAFIDVNEEGSEAAAATAVVMEGKSMHFDIPATFRADRPFLFLIVHKATGSILFLGQVANPVS